MMGTTPDQLNDTHLSERSCFLCEPLRDWIYCGNEQFLCMAGLGPLMDGYSVLASREHLHSMIDMPAEPVNAYEDLKLEVRARLMALYGKPCIFTEHGRVPVCDYHDNRANERHCYHAHQLAFVGNLDLSHALERPAFRVRRFSDFREAHSAVSAIAGEYLYYESASGAVTIAQAGPRIPRQFFRMLVADLVGAPHLANWRLHPGDPEALCATARRLREVTASRAPTADRASHC